MKGRDYCGGCGDESWHCGCPFDLNTNDKVKCADADCGAQWWVGWGEPDRPCHGCGGTRSVILVRAKYAPFVKLAPVAAAS